MRSFPLVRGALSALLLLLAPTVSAEEAQIVAAWSEDSGSVVQEELLAELDASGDAGDDLVLTEALSALVLDLESRAEGSGEEDPGITVEILILNDAVPAAESVVRAQGILSQAMDAPLQEILPTEGDVIGENPLPPGTSMGELKGKKGIILFQIAAWSEAEGHVDTWDGGLVGAPQAAPGFVLAEAYLNVRCARCRSN